MENTEKLIFELRKTKKIKNIVLARNISKVLKAGNYKLVSSTEVKNLDNLKKSEKLLYSLFDEDTYIRIKGIDTTIKHLQDSRKSDYEYIQQIKKHRVYNSFLKDILGIKIESDNPIEKVVDMIEKTTIERTKLLDELHQEKRKILSGNFKLKDENTRALAIYLINYLRLLPEEYKYEEGEKQYAK